MEVTLAGERVWLDPDRAMVWRDTLVIADPHFGKDASARARTIPVPCGPTDADLARIDALINRHRIRSVWFLGDVFDSAHAAEPGVRARLADWRARQPKLEVAMVAGNHDRHALPLAEEIGFELWPDFTAAGPWRLAHHPIDVAEGCLLCGHVHPGLRVSGPGRDRLRLPAFILGPRRAILPAFGGMTGNTPWRLSNEERGYLCAEDRTIGPVRPSKKEN